MSHQQRNKEFEMQAGDTIRTVTGQIGSVIEVNGNVVTTSIGYIHITKCFVIA